VIVTILTTLNLAITENKPVKAGSLIVADSVKDYSGIQGENNWYYGYYQGGLNSNNFKLLTEYGYARSAPFNEFIPADFWTLESNIYYTLLTNIGGHPNGRFTAARPIEQWAVRRWISEVDGDVTLSGTLAKLDTREGGNGIIGNIFVDGVPIFSKFIANNDSEGINYAINTTVKKGDIVDFIIDSNENNGLFDSTKFTTTISIPEPRTSFALCVLGLSLLFKKKNITFKK
jgi:hypothetical protein